MKSVIELDFFKEKNEFSNKNHYANQKVVEEKTEIF